MRSRSKVVFPSPGGERMRVLGTCPPWLSRGRRGRAIPSMVWGTRRAREVMRRKDRRAPSRTAPSPQIPRRTPPGAVT